MVGIEPTTDGLRNRCSTTELHWPSLFALQPPASDATALLFLNCHPFSSPYTGNIQNFPVEAQVKDRDPVYKKVGENLYRHAPSGNYYALLKRGGKQFRRSLKTADRALASRRLGELRQQISNLTLSDEKN